MFKIGDKILFKKEKQSGVIIKNLSPYHVLIETSDGFQMNVSVKDIMLIEESTNNPSAYGSCFYKKDSNKKKEGVNKQQKSQTVLKVDLHIELIASDYQQMNNFEIVQIQKNRCEDCIKESKTKGIPRLNLVHGVGKGTLKKEIHFLLKAHGLQFSDKYGFTEVIIS